MFLFILLSANCMPGSLLDSEKAVMSPTLTPHSHSVPEIKCLLWLPAPSSVLLSLLILHPAWKSQALAWAHLVGHSPWSLALSPQYFLLLVDLLGTCPRNWVPCLPLQNAVYLYMCMWLSVTDILSNSDVPRLVFSVLLHLFIFNFLHKYLGTCPMRQALLGAEDTRMSKSRPSFYTVVGGAGFSSLK